mmetsp:Transcript_47768/g.110670  ORF Transcript_47768/g.110670 Transcript_47768/m.110670 type:complete len:538 (-) Transcript_47768:145-1758(-)
MSANIPSLVSLFARLWYLIISSACFSKAYNSSASFLLASSRKRVARFAARVSRGSKRDILSSSFFVSLAIQTIRSTSTPSVRSATVFLAFAASSRASLMISETSSATLSISTEAMVLPFMGKGACSSALSTSSPAASTSLSASLIFSCRSAFILASSFSLASRAAFLSASFTFSRAMPMETFSLWKFSFFTPLAASSTRTLKMASTVVLGTGKSNSPFAYFLTSLRLRMPSLSPSYLSKVAFSLSSFLRASAFFTAFSLDSLQVVSVASVPRVHSLILCSKDAKVCLASEGGCPGRSGVFISWPLARMKSVQAFIFSLASTPASSTALAVAFTSSSSSSFSPEKGSASSLRVLAADSASETSFSNCVRSSWAFSMASLRLRSSSARCSSTRRCCSLICSTRCLPCSTPCSISNFMRSFWEPQASSSFARISSSSFLLSSKLSGVVMRTFWITLRMFKMALCSSCSLFTSSMRLRWSSKRFLLASSSFFLFSSNCLRWISCCCTCCIRLISSSFLMFSICAFFFISSCCCSAMLYCCC